MKRNIFFILIFAFVIASADNLIIVVPDGMSFDAFSFIRKFSPDPRRETAFDKISNIFVYENTAESTYITDSAASGTAMFTGQKTNNDIIGQDNTAVYKEKDGKKVKNLIEYAHDRKMLTGVLTNVRITHATPACMYAHINNRGYEWTIAEQLADADIDLIMGGGSTTFLTKEETDPFSGLNGRRTDGKSLYKVFEKKGYAFIKNNEELQAMDMKSRRVLGLFNPSHMAYEWDRPASEPSLYDMSAKAIEFLHSKAKEQKKDFVIMIESGKIDHAAHEANTELYLWELLELEKVIAMLTDYCDSTEATLVIIPDHATANPVIAGTRDGENALVYESEFIRNDAQYPDKESFKPLLDNIIVNWTIVDNKDNKFGYYAEHTGSDILGLAYGKHAGKFKGFISNTDIFTLMKEIMYE